MDSFSSSVVNPLFTKSKGISVRVVFYGVDVPVIITCSLLACSKVTVRFNVHGGKLRLLVLASTQGMYEIFCSDAIL